LRRFKRKIAKRSVFKGHSDNALKSYRRRFTDYQVMVRAQIAGQGRLQNRTQAEIAFSELLDSLGVLYESETIFLNGDRFVLVDFLVRSAKIAFEVDGGSHKGQEQYDRGRDSWLLRVHKIRTVRITNCQVFKEPTRVVAVVMKELSDCQSAVCGP
jgi:Protein of unknown function (DUF559)